MPKFGKVRCEQKIQLLNPYTVFLPTYLTHLQHAVNGSSKWEGKQYKGLRAVFSVHNEPFQIWARKKAKIKNFAGLKGKVVNIGNPGSGQRGTMEELMKAIAFISSSIVPLCPEPGLPMFTTFPFRPAKFLILAFFLAQIWKGSL